MSALARICGSSAVREGLCESCGNVLAVRAYTLAIHTPGDRIFYVNTVLCSVAGGCGEAMWNDMQDDGPASSLPIDGACDACGAGAGESCRPSCIGEAAQLDVAAGAL